MKRTSIAAIAGIAVAACTATVLPEVRDVDVEYARLHFPEATRESLTNGRRIYSLRCGACHEAWQPSLNTPAGWERAVAEMSPRAGLEGERQVLVLQYLTTFAR